MPATLDDLLVVLKSIDAKLSAKPVNVAPMGNGSEIAPDSELDSKYGNPDVRKDPPRWDGESYVGCNFSACPADYLDALASFCDWKAGKDDAKNTDDGRKYANYARKDAARARGWAARIRAGKVQQKTQAPPDFGDPGPGDDSAPF